MTILADERVDREIVERLRTEGHDVAYVAEMEAGIADEVVLEQANAVGAVLLTQDKDFGDLVFRQGLLAKGIVLLRLAGLPQASKADLTAAAFKDHQEEMAGAFTVVSGTSVRIRRF